MFGITEITTMQADLIKSFALFYLLLIGSHIDSSIFTCFELNYIKKHKWIQLVVAFLFFYFLVTLVSETGKLEFTPPIEKFIYSFIYFIGFLIVMRLDLRISILVLLLIFIIFFIEQNKDFYLELGHKVVHENDEYIYNDNKYWITFNWPYKIRLFKVKEDDFQFINKVEFIIFYFILILVIFGFIAYGGEIHNTVKNSKNLTWVDVIMDTNICKLKDRKSFWYYFKTGLGINL
jgi:hypothetical protein